MEIFWTVLQLVILLACIVLSALFSSSEMALFSLNRARILSFQDDPVPARRRIYELMTDWRRTLITIILGNMSVNSCISMLNDELLSKLGWSEAATTALAFVSGVLVLLLFGEITPMTLAHAHADKWSVKVAPALYVFRMIISPVTRSVSAVCDLILKWIGHTGPVPLTPAEYLTYLDSCVEAGAFTQKQADLLKDTFELRETLVAEVMHPRVDLLCVLRSDSPETVASKIRACRQPYLPVSSSDIDNADALLDTLAFFRLDKSMRRHWSGSAAVLGNAVYLPKHSTLNKALATFREKGISAALIADEYGGMKGLVSIQDIYSEVAGQSVELSAAENQKYVRISHGEWIFDGGCPLDMVCENSGWNDCDLYEEYDSTTISGLLCEVSGTLPQPGDNVRIGRCELTALAIGKNRVERVKLKMIPRADSQEVQA